jgi:leucyl aminopeptidase
VHERGWVQAAHSPSVIVDAATLTGACVVALGEFAAGMFANDDALALRLRDAGAAVGERLHAMPIYPEHRAELTCDIADLSSTGKGRWGGACTAAAFLEHFVDDGVVWAHLDIAGPAMTGEARGSWPKGGTGFGAAALASFVVGAAAE